MITKLLLQTARIAFMSSLRSMGRETSDGFAYREVQ